MKRIILIIGLLLMVSNVNAIEFKNTTHTITFEINDTVYIDNKNVYIECKPHTIYKDSYVYFNFTFKSHKGNADIYLGFTDNSYPKNISLFNGKEYILIEKNIDTIDYKYNEKDYWHYITDIIVKENNSIRIWIDIKENVKNGKYDFGIMPTGKNIEDSISTKEFYVLDPYYESWYDSGCPCNGNYPCNRSMFIDLGNKKFLYLQSTYLCGDVSGNNIISFADLIGIRNYIYDGLPMRCNAPIINYQILDYNNYIGTNIIRPLKSDIYD